MKKSTLALSIFVCSISSTFAQEYGGIPAITEDHVLTLTSASGRFINNGFSITLMGMPIDEAGFASGAGEVVDLEFYTSDPHAKGFNLAGEYNFFDSSAWMNDKSDKHFGAGDLMGGTMYNIYGMYDMPMGSMVEIYDQEGNESEIGLVGPGSKLSVTDKGDGVYRFEIDFETMEHKHITGAWEGHIDEFVVDFPEDLEVEQTEATPHATMYYDIHEHKMTPAHTGISLSFDDCKAIKKHA